MGLLALAQRRGAYLLGASALVLLALVSGENVPGDAASRERCSGGVELPLQVRLQPLGEPHPGAALRVLVEVEAFRDFAEAELRILAPPDVALLSSPSHALGELTSRRPVRQEFTLVVPPHGARRTVDVRVRAVVDDGPVMEQGATLNLSFEVEPSRIVLDANGMQVREVPARRLP